MGTWGVGLYANDTAADVRDTWLKKLKLGASGEEATGELIKERGKDDDPLFWLALADTQWRWGRLEGPVLDKARQALTAGGDLALWEGDGERAARARVFKKLGRRLDTPPPPPKAVRVRGDAVAWKRGQLWAYHTLDDKYVVFRIAGFDPACGLVGAPVTELLDVVLDKLPPTNSLADVGVRSAREDDDAARIFDRLAPEHRVKPMFEPKVKRRGQLPRHRLKKLPAAGTPRPATAETKAIGVPWTQMDDFLSRCFAVGGLRPGAVLRWPLADGDVAYTMVEFGYWNDTMTCPNWQLAVLDCRGDGVDAAAIAKAKVVQSTIVEGFQPPDIQEIAHRPIASAVQAFGAVWRWNDLPESLVNRPIPYRPAKMDLKEAAVVLKTYLEERYKHQSYEELLPLFGPRGVERVMGPSGVPYVIQIHIVWHTTLNGDLEVLGAIDDGRAEKPRFFFHQSLIVRRKAKR